MNDKFIDETIFEGYKNRMASKLYGLLCEREKKNGNWENLLKNIHIELLGLKPYIQSIAYWELLAKIGSLKLLNYKSFRTTVLDCIHLIKEIEMSNELSR